MTTNDPDPSYNTLKATYSTTANSNHITFNGNPNYITGITGTPFTTTHINTISGYGTPQLRPCSVCSTNVAVLPQTECMFLGGFWFCNNDCRLEFIFRQLVRTDHIDR